MICLLALSALLSAVPAFAEDAPSACTDQLCKDAADLAGAFKPTTDALQPVNFCSVGSASHLDMKDACTLGDSWNTPPPPAKQLAAREKELTTFCAKAKDEVEAYRKTSDQVSGAFKANSAKAQDALETLKKDTAYQLSNMPGFYSTTLALIGGADGCKYVDPACFGKYGCHPVDLSTLVGLSSGSPKELSALPTAPGDSEKAPEQLCQDENPDPVFSVTPHEACAQKFYQPCPAPLTTLCRDICNAPTISGFSPSQGAAASRMTCQDCEAKIEKARAECQKGIDAKVGPCEQKIVEQRIKDNDVLLKKRQACVKAKYQAREAADKARQKAADDALNKKIADEDAARKKKYAEAQAALKPAEDDLKSVGRLTKLRRDDESPDQCRKRLDSGNLAYDELPSSGFPSQAAARSVLDAAMSRFTKPGDCAAANVPANVCEKIETYQKAVHGTWDTVYTDDRMKKANALVDKVKGIYRDMLAKAPGMSEDQKKLLLSRLERIKATKPDNFNPMNLNGNAYCYCHGEFHGSDSKPGKVRECGNNSLVLGPQWVMLLDTGKAGEDRMFQLISHEMGHGLSTQFDESKNETALDPAFGALAGCLGNKQNFSQFPDDSVVRNQTSLRKESVADWLAQKASAAYLKGSGDSGAYERIAQKFCMNSADAMNDGRQTRGGHFAYPNVLAANYPSAKENDHPMIPDRFAAFASDPDVRASMGCSGPSVSGSGTCDLKGARK